MSYSPKISIIANFYKSEKYIPKLMKSVLAQTYRDFELIAVNDCSPGHDLEILRKYQKIFKSNGLDLRIVDNKVNMGISFAKYEGIKVAKGEYLTFIDGDDWLEPQALEKMITPAIENNLDLVVADCYRTYFGGIKKTIHSSNCKKNKIYNVIEIKNEISKAFFGVNIYSANGYWGKLFKKSTLKKSAYLPSEITLYEDVFFNLEFLLVSERIMFISYPAYNWRWGGISSGSSTKSEESFSELSVLKHFNDFYYRRLTVIKNFNLPDYRRILRIELYNVMRSSLARICHVPSNHEDSVIGKDIIKTVLELNAYQEIVKLKGDAYIQDSSFIDKIELKDINGLYDVFYSMYKTGWKRRLLRKILSQIPN